MLGIIITALIGYLFGGLAGALIGLGIGVILKLWFTYIDPVYHG